jgi:Trypsin-like peptidase domain
MDEEAAILEAIRGHAVQAGDALLAFQSGKTPVTAAVFTALARRSGQDAAVLWRDWLVESGHVTPFIAALQALGVPLADDLLDDPDGVIPSGLLQPFLAQAQAFRCIVKRNGEPAGSGVLVGPSLVLTAWHVIAVEGPGKPQVPAPTIEVELADGRGFAARVPAEFQSECGDDEYLQRRPIHDADVADRNDVALLKLVRPAATYLGHVSLPSPPPPPKGNSRVVVVHAPGGTEQVIDFGLIGKIRNVKARWRHDVTSKGGSSGGACFNKNLEFLGLHQGEYDHVARFVPGALFVDDILDIVRSDVAPPTLWSLDGTPKGTLVIGRNAFFQAVAAAGEEGSRVRGVRIKRTDVSSSSTGMSFSHNVLEQLLTRRGAAHRLVRIAQDRIVEDFAGEMRRRLSQSGLHVPEPSAAQAGEGPHRSPATITEDAVRLAAATEAAAAAAAAIVWVFIDNPMIALTDGARLTLESFVGAALTKPHLRLVIAGLETVAFPGAEFVGPPPTGKDGRPGLAVEFLGDFRRADILDLLTLASKDLTGRTDPDKLAWIADLVLARLDNVNGLYSPNLLPTVNERLRPVLQLFAAGAG